MMYALGKGEGKRVILTYFLGFCKVQLVQKAKHNTVAAGEKISPQGIYILMFPFPTCSFWWESQVWNAIRLSIRNVKLHRHSI